MDFTDRQLRTLFLVAATVNVLLVVFLIGFGVGSPTFPEQIFDDESAERTLLGDETIPTPPPNARFPDNDDAEFTCHSEREGGTNPILFNRSIGSYNYTVLASMPGTTTVYGTDNFRTYTNVTEIAAWGINPGSFNDALYVNGTWYLYMSAGDEDTLVFTGPTLNDTHYRDGVPGAADPGVFHENGQFHLYYEAKNVSGQPSGDAIALATSPNGVSNWTRHGVVLDVSDRAWHTGDPEIRSFGGDYYMFLDRAYEHPWYRIALARSPDLRNWTIVDPKLTDKPGGDADVVRLSEDELVLLTELSGCDGGHTGLGHWRGPVPPFENQSRVDGD